MAEKETISIKLLVDKEKNRVVFAEADKDFVDILFSFLTLPIGTIVSLADKKSNLGCMDSLYQSVKALDVQYFQTEDCKNLLLTPKSTVEYKYRNLELNFIGHDTDPPTYYICPTWTCATETHCLVSMFENAKCLCGEKMSQNAFFGGNIIRRDRNNGVVFVNGNEKFIISDGLHVKTVSAETSLAILQRFKIQDGTALEERIVTVGADEVLNLLHHSMLSKTPLTDVFLLKQNKIPRKRIKTEPLGKLQSQSDAKKMKLNILIKKSHNKVLYAVVKEDFLNFIFGFLAFPVGSVIKLLRVYSSLASIDNLYRSVRDLLYEAPGNFKDCQYTLLDPDVAFHHFCKSDQLLCLKEEDPSNFTITKCQTCFEDGVVVEGNTCQHGCKQAKLRCINPKFKNTVTETGGEFIKGSMMFMITDELIVEPHSPISSISLVNKQGVPFSDLEERTVRVGEQEALAILKASLTSKTALTDVFCKN
ncbi:hypothetical protein IFM89_002650 [Coptis chinensis]|uniref:DUF674 family protein n=1 Tax=Coptis chinensis TaxID=261450 RepID=A0A835IM49_9MAGN|nr:hypothetical protein IFM89_002650 [Coptis chinensis]